MRIERNTVQWRLMLWGRWVTEPRVDDTRTTSPFGRIAEERNAAGNHGDGIRYEIIEGTACPPDGGMAKAVEFRDNVIMHNIRCREVQAAVAWLPEQMRKVVVETYVVPRGCKPRSQRAVADRMNLSQSTVRDALQSAHSKVSVSIYGPYDLMPAESITMAA